MAKRIPKPKTVSERIRAAIHNSDESRYRIAQSSGIDEATLSRFINGKRKLSQDAIDTLAEYFGLELTEKRRRNKRS
jgi:plasmid maintenance system antidote protein VapI